MAKRKVLSVPEVLRETKKWDRQYLGAVIHSIEVSRGTDHEEKEELVRQFLSEECIAEFSATNPFSKHVHMVTLMQRLLEKWDSQILGRNYRDTPGISGTVFVFLTFTDYRWSTCDQNIRFDLKRAKAKIRNALAGLDYVGRCEPALFVNENFRQDGVEGKLILFHAHVLAWASNWTVLDRARDSIKFRFKPPAHGKSGVHMKKVDAGGAAELIGYMSKMPTLGYKLVKAGEKHRQRKSKMRPAQRRRLFMFMKDMSIFDFWFASGQAKDALRAARSEIVKRYPRGIPVTKIRNGKPVVTVARSRGSTLAGSKSNL